MDTQNSHNYRSIIRALRTIERQFQARALAFLGLTPEDRNGVVQLMLERRRDSVGYWLQLGISVAIATLGLVLGSAAVIIGAMLIAPLMGPIIELGMALVIGSPALTIRSMLRLLGSVAAAVAGAALLTLLLPFHELNPEITSRALPTALDLLIAICVALAAAFTTVRSSNETTSAAAGASIGIALVPPLCVAGFGLGIQNADIGWGALLLFVTNLTAILFIAVIAFLALGFESVNATEWEATALKEAHPDSLMRRTLEGVQRVFGSKYSRVLRIGLPALLIAGTYVPLSNALDQVAWEVKARGAVSRIITEVLDGRAAVQSSVQVARQEIHADLYVVGNPEDAQTLQDELRTRIAATTGVIPTLRVLAVPDLEAMRNATKSVEPVRSVPPATHLPAIRTEITSAIQAAWPREEMGELLSWSLSLQTDTGPKLMLYYLGPPERASVNALLSRAVSERIGSRVTVEAKGIRPDAFVLPAREVIAWIPEALQTVESVHEIPGLIACIETPKPNGATERRDHQAAHRWLKEQATALGPQKIEIKEGGRMWSIRIAKGTCAPPAPTAEAPANP